LAEPPREPIKQPVHQNRKGHPFLLQTQVLPLLRACPDNLTLREALHHLNLSRELWPSPYPEVCQDFDYPSDERHWQGTHAHDL
jgi:CTP:molybdopterin cytidylyltransferase MocA